MGLALQVGPVDGLAGLVAEAVRLVEALQRVEGDLHIPEPVHHDEALAEAVGLPLPQGCRVEQLLLDLSPDAAEAALGALKSRKAVAGRHEARDDASDRAPGHVELRGNLLDRHPDAGEVLEGAEAVVEDAFLVVEVAAASESLSHVDLPGSCGPSPPRLPRLESGFGEQLPVAQFPAPEEFSAKRLVLGWWHEAELKIIIQRSKVKTVHFINT